jgi:hypothetical protein
VINGRDNVDKYIEHDMRHLLAERVELLKDLSSLRVENDALRSQVAALRTTIPLLIVGWVLMLLTVALAGCDASAVEQEYTLVVELSVGPDGLDCVSDGPTMGDPACCPSGFDMLGVHDQSVVCVQVQR